MKQLEVKHLKFAYDSQKVLEDINLDLRGGELISLIGSSGCGKTTLLRLIAGFEKLQDGQIMIQGQEVSSAQKFVNPDKRGVGVVFQNYALFPHMSARNNILFGCQNLTEDEKTSQLRTLSQLLKIEEHLDKMPHQLSGGQQQRVAIARTIAPKPKLILFDEPFSNLDAQLKVDLGLEIRDIIKQFHLSAILVTHDIQDSMSISDRIAIIQSGRILQFDQPQKVFHHPADLSVAQFVSKGSTIQLEKDGDQVIHPSLGEIDRPQGPQQMLQIWLKETDLEIHPGGIPTIVEEISFQGTHSTLTLKDSNGYHWNLQVHLIHDEFYLGQELKIRFKPCLYVL